MKVIEISGIFLILIASLIAAKSIDKSDPCLANEHIVIDDDRRLPGSSKVVDSDYLCDDKLVPAWYRLTLNGSSAVMPTSCVQMNSCGTQAPIWLNLRGGKLPIHVGHEGHYLGCITWILPGRQENDADCCLFRTPVSVKKCTNFYVYFLQPTQGCHMAYCLQTDSEDNTFDLMATVAINSITTPSHELKQLSNRNHVPLKENSQHILNKVKHNCSNSMVDSSVCLKQLKTYSEVEFGNEKEETPIVEQIQDLLNDIDCPDGIHCSSAPLCKPPCHRNQMCTQANVCSCLPGYVGWHCRVALCKPKCLNGGKCIHPNICSCPPGFMGKYCDKVTCKSKCKNSGICIGKDTCYCKPGFKGRHCEIEICSRDCHNGGFCTNQMGWSSCKCQDGWIGAICETPLCNPVCRNGGTCAKPGVCICPYGFFGSRCETGQCNPPCMNGGFCARHNVCKCQNGWMGSHCETPICEPQCLNDGKCYKPNKCICTSGWRGKHCQKPICVPACGKGGFCLASNVCICHDGYEGRLCKQAVCEPKCQNGGICISPDRCLCRRHSIGLRCQNLIKFEGRFIAARRNVYLEHVSDLDLRQFRKSKM